MPYVKVSSGYLLPHSTNILMALLLTLLINYIYETFIDEPAQNFMAILVLNDYCNVAVCQTKIERLP